MVRLLIIGRDSADWREDLAAWEGESFEVDTETLPSAGVRNFTETSPDAVAIAEPGPSPRIEPIAKALLDQPLGQLVPIMTLGTPYRGDEDLGISVEIEASAGAEGLIQRLEEVLDVRLEPSDRHGETESSAELRVDPEEGGTTHHSAEIPTRQGEGTADDDQFARDVEAERRRAEVESRVEHPDYVLEPVDEGGDSTGSGARSDVAPAGSEEIREKLDEVRHRDYFAILGVPRSADGDEIQAAYRSQKRRFRRERLPDELVDRLQAELAEIHDALDDARAVLGDDELRRAYLAATGNT